MKKRLPMPRFYNCLFFVLLIWSAPALSQPILTESFNYTSGLPLSSNNWTVRTSSGTPAISVAPGNLDYSGTLSNNIGNKVQLGTSGQDVYRTFSSSVTTTYTSMVINVSAAGTGDYFFILANSSNSLSHGGKIYIRSNGSGGFNFGVLRGTGGIVAYETNARSFGSNYLLVLKYEVVAGETNDAIKLYVNPSPLSAEPVAETVQYNAATGADISLFAPLSSVELYQVSAATSPTLEVDAIHVGATWASVTTTQFDYGDAPVSFENTKDAVVAPAIHTTVPGVSLGAIQPDLELAPASVTSPNSNNNPEGDGNDEDALGVGVNAVKKGVTYTLSVPVNTVSGTAYLYGWIDFNNNGRFEAVEAADAVVSVATVGSSTQTLVWNAAKSAAIPNDINHLYLRLRFSNRSLADFTTPGSGGELIDERSIGNGATSTSNAADHATVAVGEVEDFQIDVVRIYDFGDLPASFENDLAGIARPAMHADGGLTLGTLIDLETAPASVTSPNENNGSGDNAEGESDEDAITTAPAVIKNVAYNITVPVRNPTGGALTGTLYAWLDLNSDGKFTFDELASAGTGTTGSIAAGATSNRTLTWSTTQTNGLNAAASQVYLRIRISSTALIDFNNGTNNTLVDERAIGNGATGTTNPANAFAVSLGEVEDYQLSTNRYDFGDVPASYENSLPARHIAVATRRIGTLTEHEDVAGSVAAGQDNNGTNGDGEDEDGLPGASMPVIIKGVPLSFTVPVTVPATSQLIAWIDFDGDGIFEPSEVMYTAATGTTQGYLSVAAGTSNPTIHFRGSQTQLITGSQVYVRIRLAPTAGTDNAGTAVDERSIGDGLSTGIYGTASEGEVEDYQFTVTTDLDYGDVPTIYEANAAATNVPARHITTDTFYLGNAYALESGPTPVISPASNNGNNGDGAEEDGLAENQLYIRTGASNTFNVTLSNTTGVSGTLQAWIDLNNNGRFELGEAAAAVTVANNATSANITFTAAQVNTIAVDKVYMRLRLYIANADGAIADNNGTAMVDERSVADGLASGVHTTVSRGEVEDYQLTVIRDFGDAPAAYENGDPASQSNASGIPIVSLGGTIDFELAPVSIISPNDNNGNNGDGIDEDAITTPQTLTKGANFVLQAPYTIGQTLAAGTRYLYGWIDLDGDGEFDVNELATTTSTSTAIGTYTLSLTWSSTQTNTLSPAVISAGTTYMRLRLSTAALSNSAVGAARDQRSYGRSTSDGEIEDYQLLVTDLADFGDVPASYENDRTTPTPLSVPARQAPSANLKLGVSVPDVEAALANAVTNPAANNGTSGDGADEDGVIDLSPIYDGISYSVRVSVFNNTGAARTLHAWIDFNNNGRFENVTGAFEYTSISVSAAAAQQTVTLTWSAAQTINIPAATAGIYMRLRISDGASITDFTSGTNNTLLDERAIGDGLSTGVYGTLAQGEIEDYRLTVIADYDYGDAPAGYEDDRTTPTPVSLPARQAISQALYLGQQYADAEDAPQYSANATGDNILNLNDEDGATPGVITRGGGYVLNVTVVNNTGTSQTLHGWIDFNNNGRFENAGALLEYTSISVPSSATPQTVTLTWTAAQSNGLPTPATPAQILMRLRITAGAVADFTTGVPGTIVDERAIGDGLTTGLYASQASIGEVEDHIVPVSTNYDYGDAPASYENGVPARNISSAALQIGGTPDVEATPQNVAANADNNGTNGDGVDEDGIDPTLYKVKPNTVFSLPVTVTNISGSSRSLMGWIDFNNNGSFDDAEAATFATVATGAINGTATLSWTAAQSANINTAFVYLRLRMINGTAANNAGTTIDERAYADGANTGAYLAGPLVGEIEDYRFEVGPSYDFGDAPVSYENNNAGTVVAARHQTAGTLYLGTTTDYEIAAQSVSAGADNNTVEGDGADEDGITATLPTLIPGGSYTVNVNVYKSIAGTGTLHGWIDLNTDGRFSANEYASVAVTGSTGAQNATLSWPVAPYSGTASNTYMRLRFTTSTLTDNTITTPVDERAVGDGLTTGLYGATPPSGEVEDYRLAVYVEGTNVPLAVCSGLGSMDPIQAGFHATIVKPASGGYYVFGENAQGDGVTNALTPAFVQSGSNGFNFFGEPRMLTLASALNLGRSQYFLLTTGGLYVWGNRSIVLSSTVTSGTAMQAIGLPPGVSPADAKMIDAGCSYADASYGDPHGSLVLLTNGGQIWVRTNKNAANTGNAFNAVQGDGDLLTNNSSTGWHLVETSAGVPLNGMLDVRSTGTAMVATDGVRLFTWGRNVFLGNNTAATTQYYATEMQSPAGLTTPIQQVDIGYGSNLSASYYVLSQSGVVHVLGNNNVGQLGIGNTTAQTNWATITQKNEEPVAAGNQTDVTSPIGEVIKISTNNHDAVYGRLMLISAAKRAYSTGSNNGNTSGVVGATTTYIPTAMTVAAGSTLLPGKIVHIEAGGHISVMAKEGSDRYGYAGHTINGSDGCNGCTASPAEYNFDLTSSTGPLCGIEAFDYGDLDSRYNLADSARHEIIFAQDLNPLKLGVKGPDSDEGPQVTTDSPENNADGDNMDSRGNDEDAFVTLPNKLPGNYTLAVPLTNNTGSTAYLYGFIDWNADGAFSNNEAVVATVPPSASQQTVNLTWVNPDATLLDTCTVGTAALKSFVRLRLTTTILTDNAGTALVDERSHLGADDGEVEDYFLDWTPQTIFVDYGNLPHEGSAINWSRASAVLTSEDLSTTRVWLGDNNNYPNENCMANDARNGGLGIRLASTPVPGSGTIASPYILDVASPSGTFNFDVTVNGNGTAGTNVYWAIWFDANGNGNFTDADDVFTSGTTAHGSPVTTTVPITVINGGTNGGATHGVIRLVATAQNTSFSKNQDGAVQLENGEVEDYYVQYLTALPVTLLSFEAHKQGQNVLLKWKTGAEMNTRAFVIERISGTGNRWEAIGTVNAIGNSITEQAYSFTDVNPYTGKNVYRLKIIDLDGYIEYSVARTVNFNADAVDILMAPNPAQNTVSIRGLSGKSTIQLLDAQGRMVQRQNTGLATQEINISNLAKGVYLVRVLQGGYAIKTFKLLKE